MKSIFKIRDAIVFVLDQIGVLMMVIIAGFIMFQVLIRAFGVGIQWTEEMSRFAYVALTFLVGGSAVARGRHITITTLLDKLSPSLRKGAEVIIHIVMAAFMVVCAYGVWVLLPSTAGVRSNSLSWFKWSYMYYSVMAGCLIMAFLAVLKAIEYAILPPPSPDDPAADAIGEVIE